MFPLRVCLPSVSISKKSRIPLSTMATRDSSSRITLMSMHLDILGPSGGPSLPPLCFSRDAGGVVAEWRLRESLIFLILPHYHSIRIGPDRATRAAVAVHIVEGGALSGPL